MRLNTPEYIIRRANRLVRLTGSRDPVRIADTAGLTIFPVPFVKQKGVYKVIERNRYIFLKEDLEPVMRDIVILHETGHDALHRCEASQFQEFNIFDTTGSRMEYEANLFAAEIMLPDADLLGCIEKGLDAAQTAKALHSDINLVALKVSDLIRRGCAFQTPEHRKNFL